MRAAAFFLCALFLLFASRARAQVEDPREVAVSLARAGVKLFKAGDYGAAYEQFRAAEEHYHAPTHVLWMARAERERNHLVEARALYQKVLAENLSDDASRPFVLAQQDAAVELRALEPRIASLTVELSGPGAAAARVFLDGTRVSPAQLGQAVDVNPGAHKVLVHSAGREPVVRELTLAEGASERVALTVEAPPPGAAFPGEAEPAPADPGAGEQEGSWVPAGVLFGIAGAALVAGAVTGALHLKDVSDIEERCGGTECPDEEQDDVDATRNLAHVSTACFAAGGAALIAGVVLAVVRPGGHDTSSSARVAIGAGSISIGGSF